MRPMMRNMTALSALVVLVACQNGQSAPPATENSTTVPSESCEVAEVLGLAALASQLADIDGTTETSEIAASSVAMRSDLEALELEGDADEWRDASIDSLTQVERRIDDPELLPDVGQHASRTLIGLESRICS